MTFLTWCNDPLLIDAQPQGQASWLTANDLLKHQQAEVFLSPEGQLRLYPMMLRKIDFDSGERLLQGFPYLLLDEQWCTSLRKQTLLLAERAHHYFTGAITNTSIRSWQKKIIQYLEEQKRLPFPLFRLADCWEEYFVNKQYVQFQSARGEHFQLPLFLSEELAYLVGVIMGDGHLAEYFINIIDSSKEHIENIAQLLDKHFHSKIEVFEQSNANAWNVNILGKWLVRFINFLSAQPINARKYPHLCQPALFCNDDLLRVAFWRGLMDADGSYKRGINFMSASEQLTEDFSNFLQEEGIQHHNSRIEFENAIGFQIRIFPLERKKFLSLIDSHHFQKQQERRKLLQQKVIRPRSQAQKENGQWLHQVVNYTNDVSSFSTPFNFTKLSQFSISGLGIFLQNLRSPLTQKKLAHTLGITSSMLSLYESNYTPIPVPVFYRLVEELNYPLPQFFQTNQKLHFHLYRSSCFLDTFPTNTFLKLMKGLQIRTKYFLIVGIPNQSLAVYKSSLETYFSLKLPECRVFYNAVLLTFVREFCVLSEI